MTDLSQFHIWLSTKIAMLGFRCCYTTKWPLWDSVWLCRKLCIELLKWVVSYRHSSTVSMPPNMIKLFLFHFFEYCTIFCILFKITIIGSDTSGRGNRIFAQKMLANWSIFLCFGTVSKMRRRFWSARGG